jgi:cyanophycinase
MIPRPIPTLMPIGGGISERGEQVILNEFLRHAGDLEAKIAIVTTASELPDSGEWYQHKLHELDLQNIPFMIDIHRREEACAAAYLDMIRQATGVFFTEGAQVRISAAIGGTPVHQALQEAYRSGAVIAGTSAGASILPAIMFAFGRGGPTPRQAKSTLSGFPRMVWDASQEF